ncbi:MAG TPA: type II toxin-antitoxin system RelE/ParE family toxin [Ardenticatenaceae bacterium]|nr:type II toxin-antitoxin system RelE/ParE family toxin [Ardenticatenaceae bacterium]
MTNEADYSVYVAPSATRDIDRLPGHIRQRVRRLIRTLAQAPRPLGSLELREAPGLYRIRLEKWRIIYQVDDEARTVAVLRVRLKTGPETYHDIV